MFTAVVGVNRGIGGGFCNFLRYYADGNRLGVADIVIISCYRVGYGVVADINDIGRLLIANYRAEVGGCGRKCYAVAVGYADRRGINRDNRICLLNFELEFNIGN